LRVTLFLFLSLVALAVQAGDSVQPDTSAYITPAAVPAVQLPETTATIDSLHAAVSQIDSLKNEVKLQVRIQLILLLIFIIILTILLLANINYRKKNDERKQVLEKMLDNEYKEKNKIYHIISDELREPLSELYRVAAKVRDGNFSFQELQSAGVLTRYRDTFSRSELVLLNLFTWTTLRSHKPTDIYRNKKETTLRELIEKVRQKAMFPYAQKNIQFINDVDAQISVMADDATLSLIIWNLLDNAIKFSPAGAPVRISAREKNHKLEISIRDKGQGMSTDFTYDFELSSYDEHTSEGLGLQVCKLLVATQQGDIWFESEKGSGTSAYFTIPL